MACVLSIGNFDGVHIGHQAILARGRALADASGVDLVVMTFDRHPAHLLRPEATPPVLLALAERVRWLKHYGADRVEVMPMDEAALQEPAEVFIQRVVAAHAPIAFAEGPDFRFGHQRGGDNALLQRLGDSLRFETHVVAPVQARLIEEDRVAVSSSLIRRQLREGQVAASTACLGRAYELSATVIQGEQRGRTIQVPTANLDLTEIQDQLIPAEGVYAGRGWVVGAETSEYRAAISIGVKPTFGDRQLTVEAHLFDLPPASDLYGQRLTLAFDRWIRPQQAFAGPEQLVAQIRLDLEACRLSG